MPATSGTRFEMNANPGRVPYVRRAQYRGQKDGVEPVYPGMAYTAKDAVFDEVHNGLRALGIELIALQQRDRLRKLGPLVTAYVKSVKPVAVEMAVREASLHCGCKAEDDYSVSSLTHLEKLVYSIIHSLNGRVLYERHVIVEACKDALGAKCPPISRI